MGTSYPEDVEQVRRRFTDGRGTFAVRSRLPEELLARAAELAQRAGTASQVSASHILTRMRELVCRRRYIITTHGDEEARAALRAGLGFYAQVIYGSIGGEETR